MSVERIVADILGVPAQEVRDSSSPDQYPQWDSAAHIEIILSAEQEYGVTFAPEEMVHAMSVGALRDTLRRKGARVE